MDEQWIAKRSQLRQLLRDQPQWTNAMYAQAVVWGAAQMIPESMRLIRGLERGSRENRPMERLK